MYLKLMEESLESLKQSMGKPVYVFISLNNLCNANCVFCTVHDDDVKHGRIDVPGLIGELKGAGTRYVHFIGGGEPFTEEKIWSHFAHITGLGMKIAITTNGLALDRAKIQELSRYNVGHIFFSLDGHGAGIHDRLRGVPGLWERVTENIRNVKRIMPHVKIVINHLLNKENIMHFNRMLMLGETVPFDYMNPLLIKDYPRLYFGREQIAWYSDNVNRFYETARTAGVAFLYDDIDIFKETTLKNRYVEEDAYHTKNFRCFVPSLSLYVDCPSAEAYPCDCTIHRGLDTYRCGNFLEQDLSAIWHGDRMERLRKKLKDGAASCKANCDPVNIFFNEEIGRGECQ